MKMFPKMKGQQGFSLVELMVVVAIIGILAALAVPRFATFSARAKQSEAKSNLSHIYTLQSSWHAEHDTYAALATIGWVAPTGSSQGTTTVRYNYTLSVAPTVAVFTAQAAATGNDVIRRGCGALDTWTMDQAKTLVAGTDCSL